MASIYVHIPFCQSRCIYCDFFSTTSIERQTAYVEALEQEMEHRQGEWPAHARTLSIYIGGGTPSTLPPALLQRIFKKIFALYPIAEDAEITLEANPDDITPQWIDALRQTPVNRISMGVQTFHEDLLKTIRRRHTAQQAREAIHRLKAAGYTNLSIDLIYGLPGQTVEKFKEDLQEALTLNIPHLSAYSLMYEEGTPIYRMREQGMIREMSEEDSIACYKVLCQTLKDAGYEHYEISNFARPGLYSRHNSAYWTGDPYLGFGAGAHSYDGESIRRWNKSSLNDYINAPHTSFEEEHLTETDRYNEYVMTRLRTRKGFRLDELEKLFGADKLHYCQDMMQPHLHQGNLVQMGLQVRLSEQGVFTSNDIISDLFCD